MRLRTKREWEVLVERSREDSDALNELCGESLDILRHLVHKRELTPVEDWVSDLSMYIVNARDKFHPGMAAWPAFLQMSMANRIQKLYMKTKREKRLGNLQRLRIEDVQDELFVAPTHFCVESECRYLRSVLNTKQNLAVELLYFWDMSHTSVGRVMGCTRQATKQRLDRAINTMRRFGGVVV